MGGACSQKLKPRRGLPSSSGRLLCRMGRRYFNPRPNRPAKTCSPGPQLFNFSRFTTAWVGQILGGSFLPSAQGLTSKSVLVAQYRDAERSLSRPFTCREGKKRADSQILSKPTRHGSIGSW